MLILPRSGLATKFGLTLQNNVGVIDEDYRGELLIKFNRGYDHPDGEVAQHLQYGQRVAQAMVLELPQVAWLEVTDLPPSVRGEGGFGSTGVK
jgi:dUTP pyrophosphatase